MLRSLEEAVRGSGTGWTILRPGGFDSNALAWAGAVRTHRTVAAPFGDVGLPTVDPADVAEVAAAALTGDEHLGRAYVLTGPARCTPREQAAAIGDALGEPVAFVELTRDQALTAMLRFMPEPVARTTLDVLGTPTPLEQQVSPDVERVLGRAPRCFADWAARNAAAFR
ncbi:NmrA family transcriptional regulator [Pseudonocardia sichuanensis]